jgi:hypothetical protein
MNVRIKDWLEHRTACMLQGWSGTCTGMFSDKLCKPHKILQGPWQVQTYGAGDDIKCRHGPITLSRRAGCARKRCEWPLVYVEEANSLSRLRAIGGRTGATVLPWGRCSGYPLEQETWRGGEKGVGAKGSRCKAARLRALAPRMREALES